MDKPQSLSSNSNAAQARTSHNPVKVDNLQQYEPLYKAVYNGDLDSVKKFFNDHPEAAVTARITPYGETALHIAALVEHFEILQELILKLKSVDDLELADIYGSTVLHCITPNRNNIKIAECLVEKNKKLLSIHTRRGWIPVTLALNFCNTEMTRYLYWVTPLEVLLPENGHHGATLLRLCYYSNMLDIALDLLKKSPRLAVTREKPDGPTFLDALAIVPSAILNESQLPCLQRWIYKRIHVYQEPASSKDEVPDSIPETNTEQNDHMMNTSLGIRVYQEPASSKDEVPVSIPETNIEQNDHMMNTSPGAFNGLLHLLVSNNLNLLGIRNMYEAKLAHKQSLQLLHTACDVISTLNKEEIEKSGVNSTMLLAAQHGNAEFIVEAIKNRLALLWAQNSIERKIFHLAVEHRQAKVFCLIRGVIQKERFPHYPDKDGNYLLHMAGMLAPSTYLNQISGAVLQMQRELQWFKEVESVMPPMRKESTNNDGMTARDLFTENHKNLVKEGEKWTKGTANSCSFVAALVATVTFAAAFTVPGGNNQITGFPVLLQNKLFLVFVISDAVSLFFSSTSVLIFLELLTSRYAEDDFLKSLPTKLIVGLSTMFISIATMMTAFCAALFLMLHDKVWISIPVTLLACLPVTLYILLQFPLLVKIYKSTYRPSIFDRNVKPWP